MIEMLQLGWQRSDAPQPQTPSQAFTLVDASREVVSFIHMNHQYSLLVTLYLCPYKKNPINSLAQPAGFEWNRSFGLEVPYVK